MKCTVCNNNIVSVPDVQYYKVTATGKVGCCELCCISRHYYVIVDDNQSITAERFHISNCSIYADYVNNIISMFIDNKIVSLPKISLPLRDFVLNKVNSLKIFI